jgi:Neutral/alkaline non-lysosomal ceramidase, N-terminal/Bacterial Ig-like domain
MRRTEVSRILASGKRANGSLGRNHGRRDLGKLFTTKVLMGLLALGLPCFGCSFKVIATAPFNGDCNVAVDRSLYVVFNTDVDATSVQAPAVKLTSPSGIVAAAVQGVTPRMVSIDPVDPLLPGTPHQLSVTTQVTSAHGVHLESNVDVQFTTLPEISSTTSGTDPAPPAVASPFQAGVAEVDMAPPVGVPLAGYGGDERRRFFPDLDPNNFYTFLSPSQGVKDQLKVKALVLRNSTERVCIVTLDAIGTDEALVRLAHQKALGQGFTVPLEKVLVCSSHTHSAPGAMIKGLLWQVFAADLYVDAVAQHVASKIAQAMVSAEQGMVAASVGVGKSTVTGASQNRRHNESPDLNEGDIDPELIVIRVDRSDGAPLATVWNFAVHGTYFGPSNLEYSADIMGAASAIAENQGAAICLFVNGAEGDIAPSGDLPTTAQLLAGTILAARQAAPMVPSGILQSIWKRVDMGPPFINLGLHHLGSNAQENWFVSALKDLGVNPDIAFHIPHGWIEREFRYQAVRLDKTVLVSMPGEPIHKIGLDLKQKGQGMGFDHVIPAGLSNGHGGYFTTPAEYGYGGYEGLLSMFGPQNGVQLEDACVRLMELLRP